MVESPVDIDVTHGKSSELGTEPPLEAMAFEQGWNNYSDAEARKLLRKIDWRIIPFLWGYTALSAVDVRGRLTFCQRLILTTKQKIIISNAALYGMKNDTHLVGQEYSWGQYELHPLYA